MIEDDARDPSEKSSTGAPAVVFGFDHDVAAPRGARRELQPMTGSDSFGDDVALVASELVTNAVRHTDDGGEMRAWDEDPLRLEVQDTSTVLPTLKPDQDVGGKGMGIVEAVTSEWGVDTVESGKVVWAVFERPGDPD